MRGRRFLVLFALAGSWIAFDQASKIYILSHFGLHDSVSVLPGYFNLTYVQNPGAAFGIFARAPAFFREIFFLIIPPLAVLIMIAMLRGVTDRDHWSVTAISLACGGALGNYIDRLRFRYVIDFLDFHFSIPSGALDFVPFVSSPFPEQPFHYSWPAFNIADCGIVIGMSMLILELLFRSEKGSEQSVDSASAQTSVSSTATALEGSRPEL